MNPLHPCHMSPKKRLAEIPGALALRLISWLLRYSDRQTEDLAGETRGKQ